MNPNSELSRELRSAEGCMKMWDLGAVNAALASVGSHTNGGYIKVYVGKDHPTATSDGYIRKHILVAEKAFGGPLPEGAIVHHHDRDRANNDTSNLVICDGPYHALIHRRMRIFDAGGDPEVHKICGRCKRLLPRTAFGSDRSTYDKLNYTCTECDLSSQAKRRTARRNPAAARPLLSVCQVREIVARASRGEMHKLIAADYPVKPRQISKIVRGDQWKKRLEVQDDA
jgi:hypothetical protein